MKKLIAFLFCLAAAVVAAQAQPAEALERKVAKKVNQADMQTRSLNAHDKAVFDVTLRVRTRFEGQAQEEDTELNKPCSAVKIDSNWLIASLTCRGISGEAEATDHNGNSYLKDVKYRKIDYIKVEGVKVMPYNFFMDEKSKVILIRVNDSQLIAELGEKGNVVANLLVAKRPGAVVHAVKQAYINRENFCLPGRCSAEIDVNFYCTGSRCYKVGWKFIDGDSGDPLFFLSEKYGKAEFLAGLNVAETNGASPQSGRFYKVFDENTLRFIQAIVKQHDPNAWARIQNHVVNEQTF